jgi:ABC-type transport system involved in cytochrome c biogenesis permease subunit
MIPIFRCAWLTGLLLLAACSRTAPRLEGAMERTESWPAEFVTTIGTLPVQKDGRVMPVSTLAAATLYAVHGRRDVQFVATDDRGIDRAVKLSPTEWLLDVWCFPEQASRYPLFRIENVGVLSALGYQHGGQTQGFEYLPYAKLMTTGEKLVELVQPIRDKHVSTQSPVESHLLKLYQQLLVYHRLHLQMLLLHADLALDGDRLRAVFGGAEKITLERLLRDVVPFRDLVREAGENFQDPKYGNLDRLLAWLTEAVSRDDGPALLPPSASRDAAPTWSRPGEIADRRMRGEELAPQVAWLESLGNGVRGPAMADRVRHLQAFRDGVVAAVAARGEGEALELESYYYRANWHFHAMMTFVLGFLIAAAACALPRSRILWWASMVVSTGAIGMLIADVWIRCLITGHPPIARLYDTFLFIGGTAAATLLLAEWVLARRIALVLAPFCGALLIMLARLFEVADGADTMRPLQAVLLSNFWLAIHVPTMNLGYAAGVAAALLGCAWVAMRALRIAHPDDARSKSIVRLTYGVTCFSLATSVVGTILGGVWANDSWGRFWGWDPKENGALLICLSQIALLHARMSGMVRDAGFVLWSIATGMVVVFSWFHTNLLGVGLHAYGFSSELLTGVWISYTVLGLFLFGGALDVMLRRNPAPIGKAMPDVAAAAEA